MPLQLTLNMTQQTYDDKVLLRSRNLNGTKVCSKAQIQCNNFKVGMSFHMCNL